MRLFSKTNDSSSDSTTIYSNQFTWETIRRIFVESLFPDRKYWLTRRFKTFALPT